LREGEAKLKHAAGFSHWKSCLRNNDS